MGKQNTEILGNNTKKPNGTENITENKDILSEIPTKDYIETLEIYINIDVCKDFYNAENNTDLTVKDFKKLLSEKTNKEINTLLKSISILSGGDFTVEKFEQIINSKAYKTILKDIKKFKFQNSYKEALKVYKKYYDEKGGSLGIDTYSKKLNYTGTLNESGFLQFLASFEDDFGEEVGADLPYFIGLYKNDHYIGEILLTKEGKETLKKGFETFNIHFGERNISVSDKMNILSSYISANKLSPDLEKNLKLSKDFIKNLEKFGLNIDNDLLVNILNNKNINIYFEAINEEFSNYDYLSDFFKNSKSNLDLSNFGINDIDHIIQKSIGKVKAINNNTKTNRFIVETKNYIGLNFLILLEKIDDIFEDHIDENENITKKELLEKFSKFLQNRKVKLDSVHKIFLAFKDFEKSGFSDETYSTENSLVEKIKNLFPKYSIFIGNNYGNLIDYKDKPEQKKKLFELLDFMGKNPSLEVDYIPSVSELENATKVLSLYKSLKDNWKTEKARLSDLFFISTQEEFLNFFQSVEKSAQFQKLKDAYDIKITNFSDLIVGNISMKIGHRATFKKDGIKLILKSILDDKTTFDYLIKNQSEIKQNLLLGKQNITIKNLNSIKNFKEKDIFINEKEKVDKFRKKLIEFGMKENDIKQIFGFYPNRASKQNTGIQKFRYFMVNEEEKAVEIIDFSKNMIDKYFEKGIENSSTISVLGFITKVYEKKSDFYDGDLQSLKQELEILAKNNIKIESIGELEMYLRSVKYDKNLPKTLENKNFQDLYNQISKKYYNGKKDILSAIFTKEIFAYASKKGDLLQDMINGDFSQIDKVMNYVKQKFSINSNNAFFLNSAIRLSENFDTTKNLIGELEKLGESIGTNDLSLISTVGKIIKQNPEKNNFFFNKNQLINYISSEVYNKKPYKRLSQGAMEYSYLQLIELRKKKLNINHLEQDYKNKKDSYTERPVLENLSFLKLWYVYIYNEGIKNLDNEKLKDYIYLDKYDTTTEVGGTFYLDFDEKSGVNMDIGIDPSVSNSDARHTYGGLHKLMPGISFHFHALGLNNKAESGPSGYSKIGGDFGVSYYTNSVGALITPIREFGKDKIKVNFDLYWLDRSFDKDNPDYSNYYTVDMGSREM